MVRGNLEAYEHGGNSTEGASRLLEIVAFVDLALLAFVSLDFSFGLDCDVCPSSGLTVVSGGCFINITGQKSVSTVSDANVFFVGDFLLERFTQSLMDLSWMTIKQRTCLLVEPMPSKPYVPTESRGFP